MNLKKLLDSVLALGSNISIKEGKDIYKNRLVSNLTSKKINDIYHIYSKVAEEDNSKEYSCHIKYNLKTEKVLGATCTCSTYEEFSKHKHNYICKHIVATYFKAIPGSAIEFENEQKILEEEYEKYQNKEYENAIKYINNMSKKELVEELIYIFDYAPEWVYDNFIRRNNIDGK